MPFFIARNISQYVLISLIVGAVNVGFVVNGFFDIHGIVNGHGLEQERKKQRNLEAH